ncbi:hypothetical protein [Mycobacterium kyorinense]|uniref:hypothetical protein n=1 Tax=Mycobacterium kyorinense TaxID=487514 RepID=UPI000A70D8C6|nr:hypothetical protein [Mycobacterium kyorinense]
MSDVLQTILADPELQQWPNRDAEYVPAVDACDIDGSLAAHGAEEIDTAAPDDREVAINKVRALIDHTEDSPGALESDSADRGHRDSPPEPPPPDLNSDDDADRDDPDDSAAETNPAEGPARAPSAAMSFDDIARRPNAIADKFGAAKDWLKDGQNWKNPKILGAAAAAIIGVAALGVWATSTTQPAPQPTAQLAPPPATPSPPRQPRPQPRQRSQSRRPRPTAQPPAPTR